MAEINEAEIETLSKLIAMAVHTAQEMFMEDAKSGQTPAHRAFAHLVAAYIITSTQPKSPNFMACVGLVNEVLPKAISLGTFKVAPS